MLVTIISLFQYVFIHELYDFICCKIIFMFDSTEYLTFSVLITVCQFLLNCLIKGLVCIRTDYCHRATCILCVLVDSDIAFDEYLQGSPEHRYDFILKVRASSVAGCKHQMFAFSDACQISCHTTSVAVSEDVNVFVWKILLDIIIQIFCGFLHRFKVHCPFAFLSAIIVC